MLRALYAFLTLDSAPSRDATFTAGVTLARACCDDNRPETSLEAMEATFFAGARGVCDGSALLRAATRVASADETTRASSFGALAVLRGFIITADDAALARRRDGDAIFDDVLPAICEFIEHGDDVHYRFHAVTCLKVALEKMKSAASMGALKTFPRDAFDRVAFVVASRWEDTFGHTVREIQTCFGLLLDIIVDSFESDSTMIMSIASSRERCDGQQSRRASTSPCAYSLPSLALHAFLRQMWIYSQKRSTPCERRRLHPRHPVCSPTCRVRT